MNMHWVFLVVAGLCEIAWAVGLKMSAGFSRLVPSVLTVIGMVASFYFLSLSLRSLPLSTAYAIWTGIGAAGAFILGSLIFREWPSAAQSICIGFIILGTVGLKLSAR